MLAPTPLDRETSRTTAYFTSSIMTDADTLLSREQQHLHTFTLRSQHAEGACTPAGTAADQGRLQAGLRADSTVPWVQIPALQ